MVADGDQDLRRLNETAARLQAANTDASLLVDVSRRWRGLYFVDGLSVTDAWTDVFEVVRRRPLWSRRWHQMQSLDRAEEAIRSFLTQRPDLPREGPEPRP